ASPDSLSGGSVLAMPGALPLLACHCRVKCRRYGARALAWLAHLLTKLHAPGADVWTRLATSPPYRCMGAPGMPRHVPCAGGPSAAARGDLNLSSTWYSHLTIRSIHCQYREFQAAGRETPPTPTDAGSPAGMLTKTSAVAACLPRWP